jgi:arylsulfatase
MKLKRVIFGYFAVLCMLIASAAKSQTLDTKKVLSELKAHKNAVLVKDDIWIRDPYIVLGPDNYYYLTGTTQNPEMKFDDKAKYNVGLGDSSLVGWKMRVWKSKNLANWEYIGEPFDLTTGYWAEKNPAAFKNTPKDKWHLWAPEIHFVEGKWLIIHTTPGPVKKGSNFALTRGKVLEGPYTHPLGERAKGLHDPSVFQDTDEKVYLTWGNTTIVEMNKDLTDFIGTPQTIYPTTLRELPDGKKIEGIGHEGVIVQKIGNKYIQFGTGWSTNQGRKGSYNLYYAVADHVKGPYGPRQFVGRFLGHGTPFKDKEGRWWCTAFFNGNIPPVSKQGIQTRDLRENAMTINKQGVTLVPLNVEILADGDVKISAIDPDYAVPGPDEVQKF